MKNNLSLLNDKELDLLVKEIMEARHIFGAGSGRSGVAMRGFVNRLMHLGKSVSLVGEISSPHTKEGDLLIIGSGSGETENLVALANKAKKNKVKIALIRPPIPPSAKWQMLSWCCRGYRPSLKTPELILLLFSPWVQPMSSFAFLFMTA